MSEEPAGINKPQRSPEELRERLETLERRIQELRSLKKAKNKEYNDEISDVQAEIDGVLEQLKP